MSQTVLTGQLPHCSFTGCGFRLVLERWYAVALSVSSVANAGGLWADFLWFFSPFTTVVHLTSSGWGMAPHPACGSAPTLVFRTSVVRYLVAGVTPSDTLSVIRATVVLTRLVGTHASVTGTVRNGDLSAATETVRLALRLWVSLPLNKRVFPWLKRSSLNRTTCSYAVGEVMVIGWARCPPSSTRLQRIRPTMYIAQRCRIETVNRVHHTNLRDLRQNACGEAVNAKS